MLQRATIESIPQAAEYCSRCEHGTWCGARTTVVREGCHSLTRTGSYYRCDVALGLP